MFLAGQLGVDSSTGKLVDGGVEAETRQTFVNLGHVLEAAGASLKSVAAHFVDVFNLATERGWGLHSTEVAFAHITQRP